MIPARFGFSQRKSVFTLIFSLFFCFSSFFFYSCASVASFPESSLILEEKNLYLPSESEIYWQKIENVDWAEYFTYENKNYPVRYHCVKINLASEKISLVVYPLSEKDFIHKSSGKTDFFKGIKARTFAKKFEPVVSLNASPFDEPNFFSSKRKVCGILVAENQILSPEIERYAAIVFSKKKDDLGYSAKIYKNQRDEDFSRYDFAIGGFFQILTDGKKESFRVKSNDSRTALGLSADGKTLFVLVVEGERKRKSKGLSYQECADIFLTLGAVNALQLDGGISSSLFINGENFLSYRSFRKNAVFLGFY